MATYVGPIILVVRGRVWAICNHLRQITINSHMRIALVKLISHVPGQLGASEFITKLWQILRSQQENQYRLGHSYETLDAKLLVVEKPQCRKFDSGFPGLFGLRLFTSSFSSQSKLPSCFRRYSKKSSNEAESSNSHEKKVVCSISHKEKIFLDLSLNPPMGRFARQHSVLYEKQDLYGSSPSSLPTPPLLPQRSI